MELWESTKSVKLLLTELGKLPVNPLPLKCKTLSCGMEKKHSCSWFASPAALLLSEYAPGISPPSTGY
jgi:hypothetical protein